VKSPQKVVLAMLLAVASMAGRAGEPVASPDALANDALACLMKEPKTGKSMETRLGKHVLPGYDKLMSVAQQMDQMLAKWLDSETMFAIHPIRTRVVGGIYEARTYLIEDTSGSLMMFQVALLKRLGKWYVYSMNINSNNDVVEKELEGE
jgi:hypothetical protein